MPRFTPGELKVMRLLWNYGELKPAELQERFPRPIKNSALAPTWASSSKRGMSAAGGWERRTTTRR